ncbi:MAG: hypothetical protein ACR2QZ_05910 [Woeseiaceae bacterium]
MDYNTRVAWLKTGSAITMGFGVIIAAAAIPALQGPTALLLDLVYLPLDSQPSGGGPATQLLSAIAGGVLVGWGLMMWLLATTLYAKEPELCRKIILTSIISWFVVDSSMSVAAGAILNAFFNIGFLLVFALPVWKPLPAHAADTIGLR